MAKTIDSFLVSLGFDLDKKSEKEALAGIKNIGSSALKMGAAVASAFVAGGYAAQRTAKNIDGVANSAKLLANVGANDLYTLGNAISLIGGNASEAAPLLEKLESIISNYRMTGDAGPLESLEKLGIDSGFIANAETSLGLLRELSKVAGGLSEEVRNKALADIGLSDGAQLLISAGPGAYDALINRARQLSEINDDLILSSRELTKASSEFSIALSGLFNSFTEGAGPGITSSINAWTDALVNFKDEAKSIGEFFGDVSSLLSSDADAATAKKVGGQVYDAVGGNKLIQSLPVVGEIIRTARAADTVRGIAGDYARGVYSDNRQMIESKTNQVRNVVNEKIEIIIQGASNPEDTARKIMDTLENMFERGSEVVKTAVAG